MRFHVRWPDGTEQACYSPSLVVGDHLEVGRTYPVGEFAVRTVIALQEASQRVRAKYGFACTASAAQMADIERRAAAFDGVGEVEVLGFT